jgi:plastocyanin
MNSKHFPTILFGLVASAVLVGSALGAPRAATLTIRHQMKGCHTWAFTGGAWKATQQITLAKGARLTVVDTDVMPHTLVQQSGPQAKVSAPAMKHMGARATVVFSKTGKYVFRTNAGEDYPNMRGMKTVGEDNVLRLVVTVK